jgi:hypothetical protein
MRLQGRPGFRSRPASVLDFVVAACVIVSIASPWWISIPPAHLQETFGFQSPVCWLVAAALFIALFAEVRAAVVALSVVELMLIAWFGWAMWVVTTPRFAQLGFPFVGTDLLGPGWYAAAVGLLVTATLVVRELEDRDVAVGWELWILAALPGFGLMRLGRWTRGLVWTALFSAALYFASTDSPDPAQFAEFGRTGNVPPALPRGPEWVLLALAALLWAFSFAATAWERRRALQNEMV